MTATLTRPATAPAELTDRQLIAAMAAALREAGWEPDRHNHAADRHDRVTPTGAGVDWSSRWDDGTASLQIWRWVDGYERGDEILVTSVAQAVDVVAALFGVGWHLTTGARRRGQ